MSLMSTEGKYIYCIIGTGQERNFGPIGIGGRGDEVLTIDYEDISMVISNHPITKLVVNRENMIAHEKVIEEVMKEFNSILPVRFGTIASSADEIRNLLGRRYREFKNILRNMDYKVELGVRGIWKDMAAIFQELLRENKEIKLRKDRILKDKSKKNLQDKREIGRIVEKALEKKKDKEREKIVNVLKAAAVDYKLNPPIGDEMFMNAAFLVDKGREKEFDNIIDDLSEEYKGRIKFIYAGPLPVFNFANITIYPEEWEK